MHTCVLPLHFDVSLFIFTCNFWILNDLSFTFPVIIKILNIYIIFKKRFKGILKKQKEPRSLGKFRAPAPGKTQLQSAPAPGPWSKVKFDLENCSFWFIKRHHNVKSMYWWVIRNFFIFDSSLSSINNKMYPFKMYPFNVFSHLI